MRDRGLIEIPLDDRDAKLLPSLYEYFKSFWSDTSQEPRPLLCGERPCAKIPLNRGSYWRLELYRSATINDQGGRRLWV